MSSLSLFPLPEEDDIVRLGGEDRLRFVGVELFIEGGDEEEDRSAWIRRQSWCRLVLCRCRDPRSAAMMI
jgi:hypothetical protein